MSRTFPDLQFHQLFLPEPGISPEGFEPEPIAAIYVVRHDPTLGVLNAPRAYSPDELPDHQTFWETFGGGTYEIIARRPTDSRNIGGTVYAKRRLRGDGAPKPWGTERTPSAPTAAGVPPGTDPTMAMMMMMMQQQAAAADRSQALILGVVTAFAPAITAAFTKKEIPPPNLPELLTAIATMTNANKPSPPPPPTALSEVLALGAAIDSAADKRSAAALEAAKTLQPAAAERPLEEEIAAVIQSAAPLLTMFSGGGGSPAG